jgi:hypothetical protein
MVDGGAKKFYFNIPPYKSDIGHHFNHRKGAGKNDPAPF